MRNYDSPFANGAYNYLRSIYRSDDINGRSILYDGPARFWNGIQGAWSKLSFLNCEPGQCWNGPVASDSDLTRELISRGIPESYIRPFGAHTLVTLDNLSFVYRAKFYKFEGYHLLVAPHITGVPFSKCGHTFVHPFGPLSDFVDAMFLLDRSVPEISQACRDAADDAGKESAERAIKTKIADTLLRDIFNGSVPENVRFHVDGLRHPADLDIVRLEIRDGQYHTHQMDIPLDIPRECFRYLPGMILETTSEDFVHSYVDPFYDDEEGWIPILCNKSV